MGIGASLFFLAVGAVLTWGVHVHNSSGFDLNTIGMILMGVGALGLLVSLLFMSSLSPYGRDRRVRSEVVEDL